MTKQRTLTKADISRVEHKFTKQVILIEKQSHSSICPQSIGWVGIMCKRATSEKQSLHICDA